MAAAPPQPGSVNFLHHFVQDCTATGQVSMLKGPATGVVSERELTNVQRLPIMFRCVLPQINQSRHALILIRPEITCVQRDHAINEAFNVNDRINGSCGKIQDYHPVWADGHTPPAADVNTFNKALRVMGERMNGIMEVVAVQLKCEHCNETDRDKLIKLHHTGVGIRFLCSCCLEEIYELVSIQQGS